MAFAEELVEAVWQKGIVVPGNNPTEWRKDECGAWIYRGAYGNRDSEYGWEIDHISPGGSDQLSNLRPLQWQNNVDKSDGRLKCNWTANSAHNVYVGPPKLTRPPR